MAVYRYWTGATGAGNGTSWTDAYTTFTAALAACTVAGDELWGASDSDEQLTVDTNYTIPAAHTHANPLKIFSVSRTDDTLAAGASIGHSTLNRSITFNGTGTSYWMVGFTLKMGAGSADFINTNNAQAVKAVLENVTFDLSANTTVSSRVQFGTASRANRTKTIGCKFKWGHASHAISVLGSWESVGDDFSAGTTHPSTLLSIADTAGCKINIVGGDLSDIGTVSNNVSTSVGYAEIELFQCKLKSGFVLLNVTALGNDNSHVRMFDCSDGDTHYQFGYANDRGTLTLDTGIYANDAIAQTPLSWKLVTNTFSSYANPFVTPWIVKYHDATSAITPYLECLRSGSTTAFTDAEVWAETTAKVTAGSTRATFYTDRVAPRSTAANQAASSKTAADWTGEHASSNWFGKLGESSLTPAETGELCMRVAVAATSATLYVDPQIRV